MKLNEELTVTSVLKTILGKDPHSEHGHVELQSAEGNEAVQSLVYALLRKDKALEDASIKCLKLAIQVVLESCEDDLAFYNHSTINSNPEND